MFLKTEFFFYTSVCWFILRAFKKKKKTSLVSVTLHASSVTIALPWVTLANSAIKWRLCWNHVQHCVLYITILDMTKTKYVFEDNYHQKSEINRYYHQHDNEILVPLVGSEVLVLYVGIGCAVIQWNNVVSRLVQHLQRWSNIKTTLYQCIVFAGVRGTRILSYPDLSGAINEVIVTGGRRVAAGDWRLGVP